MHMLRRTSTKLLVLLAASLSQPTNAFTKLVGGSVNRALHATLQRHVAEHCLRWIHIPKAAGSSVQQQETDFVNNGGDRIFTTFLEEEVVQGEDYFANQPVMGSGSCPVEHAPPQVGSKAARFYGDESCTTICAVRNPYARFVSAYNYQENAPFLGFTDTNDGVPTRCSKAGLNSFVKLLLVKTSLEATLGMCMFLPQSSYVHGMPSPINSGNETLDLEAPAKYCQEVVHTENLEREFNQVMEKYGKALRLNPDFTHIKGRQTFTPCELDESQLTQESRDAIYNYYRRDFEEFGYSRAWTLNTGMEGAKF